MINVSPVAILYDKGEGLLSERSFQLLQAASRDALEGQMLSVEENIYA
jgi:hypothetical protein